MLIPYLCCIFLFIFVNSEDTKCMTSNREEGLCVNIEDCPSAKRDLEFKIYPQICSFNGTSKVPVICCLEEDSSSRAKIGSSSPARREDKCPSTEGFIEEPKGLKLGHKAWAKCLEYQDTAFVKVEYIPLTATGNRTWSRQCLQVQRGVDLVVGGGGIDALEHEFPHMTLLGFGKNFSEAHFACGGSLISEKFILTAGHCTFAEELGNLTFAVFGILKRIDVPLARPENIYTIKRIITHPEYSPPSKYHDIALLEVDREVLLNVKVHPACLHVGNDVRDYRAYATGWGTLGYRREIANVLQNVPLWKVTDEVCNEKFPKHRHFQNGYHKASQMCYGDDGIPRDTCQGDSGGPLQIKNKDICCMYLIIGVTSFGHTRCAQVGSPGIYTRVSHYVPWIESVVWP